MVNKFLETLESECCQNQEQNERSNSPRNGLNDMFAAEVEVYRNTKSVNTLNCGRDAINGEKAAYRTCLSIYLIIVCHSNFVLLSKFKIIIIHSQFSIS